ncbi:UNVERIFIED_CONTAM: hypothetical protein FKN15_032489 [Acipenser sinensis]
MLIGADVSGCRYSGCIKWPVCALSIFKTRIGRRFACLTGSDGNREETGDDFLSCFSGEKTEKESAVLLLSMQPSSLLLSVYPQGETFIWSRNHNNNNNDNNITFPPILDLYSNPAARSRIGSHKKKKPRRE